MRAIFLGIFLISISVITAQESSLCLNPKFEQTVDNYLSYTVPTISVESLSDQFDDYLLLDAREQEEYDISHIKGARHVGYDHFDIKTIQDVSKSQMIVVYCSIGYRSEKIGEKLQDAGYKKVFNLYGSIFEWTNRNHPLVDSEEKLTQRIHAYNRSWSKWINSTQHELIY